MKQSILIAIAAVMTLLTVATITFAAITDHELTFAQSDESAQPADTVQPMMTRQQLRVHAETGPPDGMDPVQRQLRTHQNDDRGTAQGQRGRSQRGGRAGQPMNSGAGSGCSQQAGSCINR